MAKLKLSVEVDFDPVAGDLEEVAAVFDQLTADAADTLQDAGAMEVGLFEVERYENG